MKRKLSILLCAVLGVSSMMLGCGNDAVSDEGQASVEENEEVKPLKVLVSATTYSEGQKELYAGFTEATGIETDIQVVPGETAQYQQIVQSKLLTKDYPDILTYWGDESNLTPLQPDKHMLEVNDQEKIDRVVGGIYDMAGTYNGKTYGYPISGVDFTGMLYNQDIFDELNLEPPTNHEELMEVSQKILDADKGIVPIYEMGKQGGPLQAYNYVELASHFITEEGSEEIDEMNAGTLKYEDTKILETYEKKMELQDAGFMNDKTDMMTGTWDTMFEAIANDKAAMSFVYSNMIPTFYQSYPDGNINMTPFNGVASGAITQFVFPLDTGNTKAQNAFFDYLLSDGVLDQYYQTIKVVPAYTDIEVELTQPLQSMYEAYKGGQFTMNYGDQLLIPTPDRIALLQEMHVKAKTPEEVAKAETEAYAKVMQERGE